MVKLVIKTDRKDQVVDITDQIEKNLPEGEGVCTVFVSHTTCAITTADLDPGTDLDLLEALRGMLPKLEYRHPHNPSHTPDHILSSLIGPSISVPYKDGKLLLGTWQRVILTELDGPRERQIVLSFSAQEG